MQIFQPNPNMGHRMNLISKILCWQVDLIFLLFFQVVSYLAYTYQVIVIMRLKIHNSLMNLFEKYF